MAPFFFFFFAIYLSRSSPAPTPPSVNLSVSVLSPPPRVCPWGLEDGGRGGLCVEVFAIRVQRKQIQGRRFSEGLNQGGQGLEWV